MKEVLLIETFDGMRHETKREAVKHLEKLLEDTLGKPTYHLCRPGKKDWDSVFIYLKDNLSLFVLAADIIEDLSQFNTLDI